MALKGGPSTPQSDWTGGVVLGRKERFRAFDLARQAFRDASDDYSVALRAKTLLGSLLPGYHPRMMNDARRNRAWDQALRRAIGPGMRVLEIGSGAGHARTYGGPRRGRKGYHLRKGSCRGCVCARNLRKQRVRSHSGSHLQTIAGSHSRRLFRQPRRTAVLRHFCRRLAGVRSTSITVGCAQPAPRSACADNSGRRRGQTRACAPVSLRCVRRGLPVRCSPSGPE